MHIIRDNETYILFDEERVELYKLEREQGEKFWKVGDDVLNQMIKDNKTESPTQNDMKNPQKAERLVLVISQLCNLGCKYCYAQQGSYGEMNGGLMTYETLKAAILKTLSLFPEGVEKIQFFGGEPLLNFELMKRGTEWIIDYFTEKQLEIPIFTIVTNGTLITPEIHEFFKMYNVNVTISLDGNKEINDLNRVFKNTEDGTFDIIKEKLEYINRDRNYILMIEMTVDTANIKQFLENGGELVDIEELLRFRPDMFHIVPAMWPDGCAQCRRYDGEYINHLKEYFSAIVKKSVDSMGSNNPFNVMKAADMALEIVNKRKRVHMCGAGIYEYSVSVNGDIYPCFAFIGEESMNMGNVNDEKLLEKFTKVRQKCIVNTFNNVEKCKNCWANGLCSNCIGNSYLINGSISEPLEEICEVQKAMLEKVIVQCNNLVEKGM